MPRQCIVATLVVGVLLAGCHASTDERVLIRLTNTDATAVRNAPYAGHYRLYAGDAARRAPTTRTANPVLTRALAKGDAIGFARDRSGRPGAVVRGDWTPLGELPAADNAGAVAYAWTMQPHPGQIDSGKTALLALGVTAAGGVVVVILIATKRPTFKLPPIPV